MIEDQSRIEELKINVFLQSQAFERLNLKLKIIRKKLLKNVIIFKSKFANCYCLVKRQGYKKQLQIFYQEVQEG